LRKTIPLLLLVLALAGISVGTAAATPASGVSAVTQRVSLGSFDFVVQFVRIVPGGTTGWHTHPGPTSVFIQAGELTLYQTDCSSESFQAGERFSQPSTDVHVARNEGPVTLVFVAIYFLPPGAPIRVDQANPPGCAVA
jgi:quercetin dioxygenase-like cupin family protein